MVNDNYLSHHGILGQKWGVRRYQNSDGSLTNAGKMRYNAVGEKTNRFTGKTHTVYAKKDVSKMTDEELGAKQGHSFTTKERLAAEKNYKKLLEDNDQDLSNLQSYRSIANDARQVSDSAKTFTKTTPTRNRYNQRANLTQEEIDAMDNKELQALVTRLNLEQQYSNLTADKVPPSTAEKMQTGLEYTSAILGITGAALGIATSIYKMKNG